MILIDSLTKVYGQHRAVDDVTFRAEPGRVTGFLGPNGAGKSTTLRILTGLTPATSGRTSVLGRHYGELPNPGREIGVLLDASAQHAGRTGREVLQLARRTMGLPAGRVEEMLDLVSLTDAEAGRRVRDYSLGMRQRLGIATALLGDPAALVLDEPANGLDPAGIRWMRDLLRGHAGRGGTVLLSSHLLHEIEVIADDLVVIGQGRIVARGTKAELLSDSATLLRVDRPAEVAEALGRAGWQVERLETDAATATSPAGPDSTGLRTDAPLAEAGRLAHAAGSAVLELRPADGAGLEDMFLQLTSQTQRDTPSTTSPTTSPEGAAA